MASPNMTVRAGHPDFLDLEWEKSVVDWSTDRIVELPKGISRHEVRFVVYAEGTYVIKELPRRAARRDYDVLRRLEGTGVPSVVPIGLIEERSEDPHEERSAALITRYADFSFSYRELLEGPGFGSRRNQMLDAFAWLLVELHLIGCFWGDCSLSNVLYRYDADAIETIMVDGETAEVQTELTDGRRAEDIQIMIQNVAGGMADIAALQGFDLDEADLHLGEDIAERYFALWDEINQKLVIGPDERWRIRDRIERLNDLGVSVDEVELQPAGDGQRLKVKIKIGVRDFHARKLEELTGVRALDQQARYILGDLHYFSARQQQDRDQTIDAIRWRVEEFRPLLRRLEGTTRVSDPIQAYCDILHHRFVLSRAAGRDVGTTAAVDDWFATGQPGYPLTS
jgi:hypothetical protein